MYRFVAFNLNYYICIINKALDMFHRFSQPKGQYKSYQTILIMTLCGITHGSACGKIHFQWFSLSLCFNAVLVFKYHFSENHFKMINTTANNALHAYMPLH